MKPIQVSTWDVRAAEADLDEPTRRSETGISVRISTPGYSNDPEALKLTIRINAGPGSGEPREMITDLRAPDFRSLVAVLETAIATAENAGILPKELV